jgi:hypothetical protein
VLKKITEEKTGKIWKRKQACKLSFGSMNKTDPFGSLLQHTVENNAENKKLQVMWCAGVECVETTHNAVS